MTSFTDHSPRTWLRLAAAIYAVCLLLLLFSPAPVERALRLDLGGYHAPAELVANVLIFLPVGFAAARWLHSGVGGIVVGIGVSLAAEIVQYLWLPERNASFADIVKNAVGTTLGAALRRPVKPVPPSVTGSSQEEHR